jgi:hypothetical protein
MILLLTLAVLASTTPSAQKIDTTQVTLLRYQLKEQLGAQMKQQHDAMKTDFENFKRELRDEMEKKLQAAKEEVRSPVKTYSILGGALLGFIAFVLSFLGYERVRKFVTNFSRLDKRIDETVARVDSSINRIDPRDTPIKLPATGMEKQWNRLQQLEFRRLSTYEKLDDACTRDVIVFPASDDKQAEVLKRFLEEKKLAERDDVVFVVYTHGLQINQKIFAGIENVTFANTPLTLVQALFVAARGIVRQAK